MSPVRLRARHKFNAQACVIDGIRFASQKEGRRYRELKLLEKAGEITRLSLQPEFPICVSQSGVSAALRRTAAKLAGDDHNVVVPVVRVCVYRGDFSYWTKDGQRVIEDVKGVRTPVYRLKKRMVEAAYGITITEV